MKDEKDWSKATKAELIQKANIDYPIGTRVKEASSRIEFTVSGLPMIDSELDIMCDDENGNKRYLLCCYSKNEFKWAEIINELKEASPESQKEFEENNPGMDFSNDASDSVAYVTHSIPPEPKAGDMVEWSIHGDKGWSLAEYHGKTKGGKHVVSSAEVAAVVDHVRLPQKSEVESKAKEMLKSVNLISTDDCGNKCYLESFLVEYGINCIKWGQQNKDAK